MTADAAAPWRGPSSATDAFKPPSARRQEILTSPADDGPSLTRTARLAEYPIPADLIQAFRKAIVAFDDWRRGDVERLINHAGKLCPIDVICSFLGFADE